MLFTIFIIYCIWIQTKRAHSLGAADDMCTVGHWWNKAFIYGLIASCFGALGVMIQSPGAYGSDILAGAFGQGVASQILTLPFALIGYLFGRSKRAKTAQNKVILE